MNTDHRRHEEAVSISEDVCLFGDIFYTTEDAHCIDGQRDMWHVDASKPATRQYVHGQTDNTITKTDC